MISLYICGQILWKGVYEEEFWRVIIKICTSKHFSAVKHIKQQLFLIKSSKIIQPVFFAVSFLFSTVPCFEFLSFASRHDQKNSFSSSFLDFSRRSSWWGKKEKKIKQKHSFLSLLTHNYCWLNSSWCSSSYYSPWTHSLSLSLFSVANSVVLTYKKEKRINITKIIFYMCDETSYASRFHSRDDEKILSEEGSKLNFIRTNEN